jgi:hypothetical protein
LVRAAKPAAVLRMNGARPWRRVRCSARRESRGAMARRWDAITVRSSVPSSWSATRRAPDASSGSPRGPGKYAAQAAHGATCDYSTQSRVRKSQNARPAYEP